MDPSQTKPWYKKLRYLVPLGAFVFVLGANAMGGNVPSDSAQSSQTANILTASQTTSSSTTSASPTRQQVATSTPVGNTVDDQIPQSSKQTQPTVQTTQALASQSSSGLSNDNYYTNVSGNQVHDPAYSNDNSIPAGVSAQCRDGTYSFSQHRSGTCSHHGGVATWY